MIKIEINDKDVRAMLDQVKRRAGNPAPLMKQIAGIMHYAVEENFEKEGRPKWKPLAKSTIKQRTRKGYWPGKILQQKGQLAASISQKSDTTSAEVGTNKAYAAIQQFGGAAGREHKARIPARPFLRLTDADVEAIKMKVIEYLKGGCGWWRLS
jgi:phage virion morphogenesis protein